MFYSILLNEKHPSYDRDDRTYKILFAKDDIMRQTKYLKKKKKTTHKTVSSYCLLSGKNSKKSQRLQRKMIEE